jgi:hypothetical protein
MRGKGISAADQEFAKAGREYQIGPAGRNRLPDTSRATPARLGGQYDIEGRRQPFVGSGLISGCADEPQTARSRQRG